ncbi:MAG TPA: NAD(P)H-hydrate dehydratase [Gemmatimonadaceae bacterium]|nr:NAD(P)H-hydrate dehydratase [Gemmatimonadaceae bacterium]
MPVFVTTAQQAAARDAAAIAAGTPSSELMARAGRAATDVLLRRAKDRVQGGVAIFAGTGNNGGDAWVVAELLRAQGVVVRVHALGEPSTPDARAARDRAVHAGPFEPPHGFEAIAVDGVLGTGARGVPRLDVIPALQALAQIRHRGAYVLALDVPSGLDASTGEVPPQCVPADSTVTFGTVKRGLLIARGVSGAIDVADIGLGAHAALADGAPPLVDEAAVRASIPRITADAHKGTRGRVAIVGGREGMAGATILAARGALRSGAGLVRVVVAAESLAALQSGVPEATGATWPVDDAGVEGALGNPDALVLGPGFGAGARPVVERILQNVSAPAVLDADALNAFTGDVVALRAALGVRQAVITPHPAECARLAGVSTDDVLRDRFEIGLRLASMTNAVVVLKGTPTVVSAPDGRVTVAPVGSPVLATGGSGDVLAGITGALLAVMSDAHDAALAAVWAHGTAAELVARTAVRGSALTDVVDALRDAWSHVSAPLPDGLLAMLPAVGEQ